MEPWVRGASRYLFEWATVLIRTCSKRKPTGYQNSTSDIYQRMAAWSDISPEAIGRSLEIQSSGLASCRHVRTPGGSIPPLAQELKDRGHSSLGGTARRARSRLRQLRTARTGASVGHAEASERAWLEDGGVSSPWECPGTRDIEHRHIRS